jgi:hypothetical protein
LRGLLFRHPQRQPSPEEFLAIGVSRRRLFVDHPLDLLEPFWVSSAILSASHRSTNSWRTALLSGWSRSRGGNTTCM